MMACVREDKIKKSKILKLKLNFFLEKNSLTIFIF